MKSEILKKVLNETPAEVKIFTELYADIVIRINSLLKEKEYPSQKIFAENMGKKPSEVNKWLRGEHNLTLKSIAKMTAELGEPIINIPNKRSVPHSNDDRVTMTVYKNNPSKTLNTDNFNNHIAFTNGNKIKRKVS